MKKTVLGMAAAAMLFAGCSKEELVDETMPSEGVSSVASTPGQEKNFWSSAPSIWFNDNNGRMFVRLKSDPPQGGTIRADIRITFQNGGGQITVDPNDDPTNEEFETAVDLQRIGNSRIYRSARNAADLPEEFDFSMANINLSAGDEEVWNGDVFLYPSGRTVAQDPTLLRGRVGPSLQTGVGANGKQLAVIIADDPTQEVASVVFESLETDEDGVSQKTRVELEQTHFNQNLGLSRWTGSGRGGSGGSGIFSGEMYLLGSGSYGVDFLDETSNTVIKSRYDVRIPVVWHVIYSETERAPFDIEENDDPVFLGTALRSRTGETWTYEVALADLGEWVESATATISYSDPKGFNTTETQFDMELVRTEGNLKVFRREGLYLEGLEPGTEVQALVSGNGKGTKKATSQIGSTASISLL
jgi:hypothetical protein